MCGGLGNGIKLDKGIGGQSSIGYTYGTYKNFGQPELFVNFFIEFW